MYVRGAIFSGVFQDGRQRLTDRRILYDGLKVLAFGSNVSLAALTFLGWLCSGFRIRCNTSANATNFAHHLLRNTCLILMQHIADARLTRCVYLKRTANLVRYEVYSLHVV